MVVPRGHQALNLQEAIDRVLEREGGFVHRADDPGGATKFGITLDTLKKWRGGVDVTVEDVRQLSLNEARSIYLQVFVKDTHLEDLAGDELQEAMFDWMVNSGPARPIRALQARLGVTVDGFIGPETVAAAARRSGIRLAAIIMWDRVEFIANWMRSDKTDRDHDGVPDSMENAAGILKRIAALGRALAW